MRFQLKLSSLDEALQHGRQILVIKGVKHPSQAAPDVLGRQAQHVGEVTGHQEAGRIPGLENCQTQYPCGCFSDILSFNFG